MSSYYGSWDETYDNIPTGLYSQTGTLLSGESEKITDDQDVTTPEHAQNKKAIMTKEEVDRRFSEAKTL